MSESMDAAGRLADDSVWAENERLTAALVEIRDYPEGEDGRLDSMEAIAREALATTEQEREL